MKPGPPATVLDVRGLVVTDVTYAPEPRSQEHEHELPFVATVLAGALEKRLGGTSVDVSTFGTYLMPSGVPHTDGFPVGARVLSLELDPTAEIWAAFGELLGHLQCLRGPELATLARRISVELQAQDDVRAIAVEGLGLELVAAAVRSIAGTNGSTRSPPWLATVDAFLAESFLMPLRVGDVADVVHVHPGHLARVFRVHHGETIARRIRRLRLDWALGELIEGELSVKDIATRAGFADQSHFSRCFKQRTGWSPTQYRRKHRPSART